MRSILFVLFLISLAGCTPQDQELCDCATEMEYVLRIEMSDTARGSMHKYYTHEKFACSEMVNKEIQLVVNDSLFVNSIEELEQKLQELHTCDGWRMYVDAYIAHTNKILEQTKSYYKEIESNSLPTNYGAQWYSSYFVDEAGQNSGNKYIYTDIAGWYRTYGKDYDPLNCKIMIDGDEVSLMFFEVGFNLVTSDIQTAYTWNVDINDSISTGQASFYGDRLTFNREDSEFLINLLQQPQYVRWLIEGNSYDQKEYRFDTQFDGSLREQL